MLLKITKCAFIYNLHKRMEWWFVCLHLLSFVFRELQRGLLWKIRDTERHPSVFTLGAKEKGKRCHSNPSKDQITALLHDV